MTEGVKKRKNHCLFRLTFLPFSLTKGSKVLAVENLLSLTQEKYYVIRPSEQLCAYKAVRDSALNYPGSHPKGPQSLGLGLGKVGDPGITHCALRKVQCAQDHESGM